MLSRLVAHFSRYSLASLLVTLASVVSFPFLTRIFSVEAYGWMSLIGVLVTGLAAVAKLGVQQAALRFFSDVRAGLTRWTLQQYESTVCVGLAASGLLVTGLWCIGLLLLPDRLFTQPETRHLLFLVAPLTLLQCLSSAIVNQLRAREMSGVLSLYSVLQRYVSLTLMVGTLLYVSASLWGFYTAQIIAESLALIALAGWYFRREPWSPRDFSPSLYRSMLRYSLPLVGMELSSVLLNMGDRILIERMLGAAQLGIYSAPYNLSDYIGAVLVMAFTGAVTPMVLRLWADEGATATREFLQRVLHLYLLFAIPMVAGVSAVAEPLLTLVASEKYRAGASIIPWVIGGIALQGLFPVASAGLQIEKRSPAILLSILSALVLNVALNILLIPRWGLDGAAIATLLSCLLMVVLAAWQGRNTIWLTPQTYRLAIFVFAALVMYLLTTNINLTGSVQTLLTRILSGIVSYSLLVIFLDKHTRHLARQAAGRFGAGRGQK